MKKAIDQTVRDLKREVNKKVLKVPGIEQKVLDSTSNEPWGPHGSLLADIAQSTRNHHEYQLIMTVIWKRINDTGKNWRHVYKALTVLEFLVAHGSERVIDEIREHAYQISTLSGFQYIDSSGRDQGGNVRRKSQTLVALVNDKEKIQEARQKAVANKDKYRSSFSTGGSYRPSSHSGGYGDRYDDDRFEGRYANRDEDRNGYGRERDWSYGDDDRYGRGGDSYNREGDRSGRDPDERHGGDNYRDDDYQPRNRSFDRDGDRSLDDNDQYSTRTAGGRADESSQDDRRPERKLSEPNAGAPPSYEEAIRNAQNRMQDERVRNGGIMTEPAAKVPSPPVPKAGSPSDIGSRGQENAITSASSLRSYEEVEAFDEFDPRGFSPVPPPVASSSEVDLFGSVPGSDSTNLLALMPLTSSTTSHIDVPQNSGFGTNFAPLSMASSVLSQPTENPFGETPFKAVPEENYTPHQQNFVPATTYQTITSAVSGEPLPSVPPKVETIPGFDFGNSFYVTYAPNVANGEHSSLNPHLLATEFPLVQSGINGMDHLHPQPGNAAVISPQTAQHGIPSNVQTDNLNKPQQTGPSIPLAPQPALGFLETYQSGARTNTPATAAPNLIMQSGLSTYLTSQAAPSNSGTTPAKAQPSKDKFEPKSTVWTDTLSRGLVNLNISGPKINPLADIGVDFDSINRMEKRKERSSATAATNTASMGKAMGAGSGIGRVNASSLAPPQNPLMGPGVSRGMGMGAYGAGMNQPMGMGMNMGMGMGMGMNMGMGMGMGMNMGMGMGQPAPMRPLMTMPPGPGIPGVGYNPMMGMGNYGPQQPYGGGYR